MKKRRSATGEAAFRRTENVAAAVGRDGIRPIPVTCTSPISRHFILSVGLLLAANSASSAQAHNGPPPSKATSSASTVAFTDITRAAGIDFHLTCGSAEKQYIMESMCGGVAVFDYDNDGWMDILLVNGSTLEDLQSGKCHSSKLYRNNHDGTFKDVTA